MANPKSGSVDWRPEWKGEDKAYYEDFKASVLADPSPVRKLRSSLKLSQEELADFLGTSQSAVSKLEIKSDPKLSLLKRIVEGKGGKLRVVADFDFGSVDLTATAA